jgi:hypothetical protein
VGVEEKVLDDQRYIVDAVRVRQPQCGARFVVDDEHAHQPLGDLLFGLAVRMGVVPE